MAMMTTALMGAFNQHNFLFLLWVFEHRSGVRAITKIIDSFAQSVLYQNRAIKYLVKYHSAYALCQIR